MAPVAASVAAVLAALLLPRALADAADAQAKSAAFMKCFAGNEAECFNKQTAWEHFTEDLPSCLTASRVWWSAKPSGIPVTLVTQLSAERLPQLKAQCASWGGPLAAALYLPLLNKEASFTTEAKQKLQVMTAHADELFNAAEQAAHGCQLRLVLMFEVFADPKALILYPVNSLRNYARLLADTDLITNIDVDMIPSLSITKLFADNNQLAAYSDACRQGALYVWPAFETHCGGATYAENVAAAPKFDVQFALKKCLRKMRPKAPFSHNATDYAQWMTADRPYPITYTPQYEPWFLSWRWGTLWYDYRFRGYGKNKIVQAAAMAGMNATWLVSSHGFLVHRKHTESRIRREFLKAKFSRKAMEALKGTVYEHVESLWAGAKAEIDSGTYKARVERSFQTCMHSLPWWQRQKRL